MSRIGEIGMVVPCGIRRGRQEHATGSRLP
jgi:hypothetical protein